MSERIKVDTFEGHTIYLDSRSKRFEVGGEDFENRVFASFDEATAAIGKAKTVKQKIKHESVKLEVLKHDGSGTTTIKGIHQRHGNLLFADGVYSKDASETYSRIEEVYPVAAWISRLLQEREAVRKRREEIERELRSVRIKVRRSYGNITSPEQYDREIVGLKAEHERLTKLAREKAEKVETEANKVA